MKNNDLIHLEVEALKLKLKLKALKIKNKLSEAINIDPIDIENIKTSVTHTGSRKNIDITYKYHIHINSSYIRFYAFGVFCTFQIVRDTKVLGIDSMYIKDNVKTGIEKFFGTKIKKEHIYIRITPESWENIKNIESEFEQEKNKYLERYEQAASLLPTFYTMHFELDWGDYLSNTERSIRLKRPPLSVDNGDKTIKEYLFWNKRIADRANEWSEDWEKVTAGDTSKTEVIIPEALAHKWIKYHFELDAIEQAEKEKKEKAAADYRAKEKAEREAKFAEAKRTGKKVLLYSEFLSDNQIPRRFRDDDSDMGHLLTYAMPDGSTSEDFSHAY